MASRRQRLIALATARDVGAQDLDLARVQGAREGQNNAAAARALDTLMQIGVNAGVAAHGALDKRTDAGAARFAASLKGDVGQRTSPALDDKGTPLPGTESYVLNPYNEAHARAGEAYPEKPKTGDALKDFFADPFDIQRGLTTWERRKAATAGASEIAGAREAKRKSDLAHAEKVDDRALRERGITSNEELRKETLRLNATIAGATNDVARGRLDADTRHRVEEEKIAREKLEQEKAEEQRRAEDAKADRDRLIAQDKERNRIADERLRLIREKAEKTAKATKGLSPKQVGARVELLENLDMIEELERVQTKVTTGYLGSTYHKAKKILASDPDWTLFLKLDKAVQRGIAKQIEGGRLTDFDAKDYQGVILNPDTMDPEEYRANLAHAKKTARRALERFDRETIKALPDTGDAVGAPGSRPRADDDDDFSDFQ